MRMHWRWLVITLLWMMAPAALAQDGADAGTPIDPDAGTTEIWKQLNVGVGTLELPPDVTAGSVVGAGLDPTAAGQVIHPDNMKDLLVGLRQVGGVLQDAQTSLAIQFNPYMLAHGNRLVYDQLVDARAKFWPLALLQDTALTLAIGPGTPYTGETFEPGRFATFAIGFSTELLGSRSYYTVGYRSCLQGEEFLKGLRKEIGKLNKPKGWDKRDGETDEQRDARHATISEIVAYNKGVAALVSGVKNHIAACTEKYIHANRNGALFLSVGERFVTPGPARREGDALVVQRHYAALSGSTFINREWDLAGQLRVVSDRPRLGAHMDQWTDAGLSIAYANPNIRFALEATQGVTFKDARPVATLSGGVRLRLVEKLSLQLGISGRSDYFWNAPTQASVGLTLAYEEDKIVELGKISSPGHLFELASKAPAN